MLKLPLLANNKTKVCAFILSVLLLNGCGGSSSSDTSSTTVSNLNPSANAGNDATYLEATEVTLIGTGTDSDGTISGYSWRQTDGTTVTLSSTDTSSSTFTAPDVAGDETLVFELSVIDDDDASSTAAVTITINNTPASASASADSDIISGTSLNLSAVENTGWSYSWQQISGPSLSITNAENATASFIAPFVIADTNAVFELTVTDDKDRNDASQLTVNIMPDLPEPIANAGIALRGSTSSNVNNAIPSIFLNGSSSYGINFNWAVTSSPENSNYHLTSSDNPVSGFVADIEGDYELTLTVDNARGLSKTDVIIITMLNDIDGDGVSDSDDQDKDGDGFFNADDAFANDKASHIDSDSDGQGNYYNANEDGDALDDHLDRFPFDAAKTTLTPFRESKELVSFNNNDGVSVAEIAGSSPLNITGLIYSDNQGVDLDFFKLTLSSGVYSIVINDVQGDLSPSMTLISANGNRMPIAQQSFFDGSTKELTIAKVPAGGDYYLIITDKLGRSGDNWTYDLTIQPDTDRDGITDDIEIALDMNHLSSDSDGDGISDLTEYLIAKSNWQQNLDSDDDGIPIWWDVDSDGDSIPDSIEFLNENDIPNLSLAKINALNDVDNDGVLNFLDNDSDGNGQLDRDEIGANPLEPSDFDNDLIADFIDLDNDNDGLLDIDESIQLRNNMIGQEAPGEYARPYAETIGIVSVENYDLGIDNVCLAGNTLTVTGRNLPATLTDLFGVFEGSDNIITQNPTSIVDGIATFSCPDLAVNQNIIFTLAFKDDKSDSVFIRKLSADIPSISSVVLDPVSNMLSVVGENLDDDLTIQTNAYTFSTDNTFGSATGLSVYVGSSLETGYVSISSENGESNALWIKVTRIVTGGVNSPNNDVVLSELDLGLLDEINPDAHGQFTVQLSAGASETLVALLEEPGSTEDDPIYSSYLSSIVLPGETTTELSSLSTAVALVWNGLGINQVFAKNELAAAKAAISALAEIESFGDAISQALANDAYGLDLNVGDLKLANEAALIAGANWVANEKVRLAKRQPAEILPGEVDDISVYEYGDKGNIGVENDTQLYLSVKITTHEGKVLQQHVNSYFDQTVGPQGIGLLFWAQAKEFEHPKGINATVEVITPGLDLEHDPMISAPESIWRRLFFRTWVERVIWPVLGEFLGIMNVNDFTNILISNGPALVDTVTTKALKGDVEGAMGDFLSILWTDFASVPPGPITKVLAQKFGKNLGEKLLKKVAVKLGAYLTPGIGQVSAAYEVAGHINNGVNASKAVLDVIVTDQVIHYDVYFPLQLTSVQPSKVQADENDHTFTLNGEGFSKIKRGIWPFNHLLEPEITFTDADGNTYITKPDSIDEYGESMKVTVPGYFFDENLLGPISVKIDHPTDESGPTSEISLIDAIEVVNNVEITSISPDEGGVGQTVTIYGSGFSNIINKNEVTVGGEVAIITSASFDQLTIIIPYNLEPGLRSLLLRVQKADSSWSDWVLWAYNLLEPQVEIIVCDNGSAKDDAFSLFVNGEYQGTMNATNFNYCKTFTPLLAEGSHSAVLVGVEAPDSVGTYSINFTGVSNLTGSSTYGSDLTPGVRKFYKFDVSLSSLRKRVKAKEIKPNIEQTVQEVSEIRD